MYWWIWVGARKGNMMWNWWIRVVTVGPCTVSIYIFIYLFLTCFISTGLWHGLASTKASHGVFYKSALTYFKISIYHLPALEGYRWLQSEVKLSTVFQITTLNWCCWFFFFFFNLGTNKGPKKRVSGTYCSPSACMYSQGTWEARGGSVLCGLAVLLQRVLFFCFGVQQVEKLFIMRQL